MPIDFKVLNVKSSWNISQTREISFPTDAVETAISYKKHSTLLCVIKHGDYREIPELNRRKLQETNKVSVAILDCQYGKLILIVVRYTLSQWLFHEYVMGGSSFYPTWFGPHSSG